MTPSVAAAWARIEALLASRLAAVEDEILRYPAPIPACDAQFNYLLEQRSDFPQELTRARALARSSASSSDPRRALDEFVNSCPHLKGIDPYDIP